MGTYDRLICRSGESVKHQFLAISVLAGSAVAGEVSWIQVQPGLSVGSPSIEMPVRTEQPGIVMTYRVRMPAAQCWTRAGTIDLVDLNEEKVLSSLELGKSKAAEKFADLLCSVVRDRP